MRYPLIGGPMGGASWEVEDTARDLVYAPGPFEQMPDGRMRRRVFIQQSATAVPAEDRSVARYVFDPTAGGYVWHGAPPEREVHQGVAVERFK